MENENQNNVVANRIMFAMLFSVIAFAAFVIFMPVPEYTFGFETIDEMVKDANSKDEFVKPDVYKPGSYKSYKRCTWRKYRGKIDKSLIGRKLERLLFSMGLKKTPAWSPSYFRHLIKKQAKEKPKKGYRSEYVVRLVPSENARFVIWGDLHGAYHSLVRGLQKLISLNILSKDLKIISPNDYIVFLGDAVTQSPFVRETISVMAKLEEKNRGQVWYIAGNNERIDSWQEHVLGDAYKRFTPWAKEEEPFSSTLVDYFHTLPLGLYLSVPPHNSDEFVRISHFSRITRSHVKYRGLQQLLYDENYADKLLADRETNKQKLIPLRDESNTDRTHVDVKAIINSVFKRSVYKKEMKGLQELLPDAGVPAWTVVSCPSFVFSDYLGYKHDAFAILQAAPKIEDWTITRYSREVKTKEDFQATTYNLLRGTELSEKNN
ncbi:metallophosphoesterase [Candidatus Babeliales bacterium]|nr:metallophosphoesterase [Candidatus Babeliales bacterium]